MFVKRNAATVQGVLCDVMNIFMYNVFQKMLCTPLGYSTYAVCFFSNLENVLFLSMFYVVMHRCIEMHVDVYDIDAFRCTTIYIYIHIYIYTQMIVDVYRSEIWYYAIIK